MKLIVSILLVALCARYAVASANAALSTSFSIQVNVSANVTGLAASLTGMGSDTLSGCVDGLVSLRSQLATALQSVAGLAAAALDLIIGTLLPAILGQIQAANVTITGLIGTAKSFATAALINLYAALLGLENLKAQILFGVLAALEAAFDSALAIGSAFANLILAQLSTLRAQVEAALQASIVTALQLLAKVQLLGQLSIDVVAQIVAALARTILNVERSKLAYLANTLVNVAGLTVDVVAGVSATITGAVSLVSTAFGQAISASTNASSSVKFATATNISVELDGTTGVLVSVIKVIKIDLASVTGSIAAQLNSTLTNAIQNLGSVVIPLFRQLLNNIELALSAVVNSTTVTAEQLANLTKTLITSVATALNASEQACAALANTTQAVQSNLTAELTAKLGALKNLVQSTIAALQAKLVNASADLALQIKAAIDNAIQVLVFVASGLVRLERKKIEFVLNVVAVATDLGADLLANLNNTVIASISNALNSSDQACAALANTSQAVQSNVTTDLAQKLNALSDALVSVITALKAKLATASVVIAAQISATINTVVQNIGSVVSGLVRLKRIEIETLLYVSQSSANVTGELLANISVTLNSVSTALNATEQVGASLSNASQTVQSNVITYLTGELVLFSSSVQIFLSALQARVVNTPADLIAQLRAVISTAIQVSVSIASALVKQELVKIRFVTNTLRAGFVVTTDLLANINNWVNTTVSNSWNATEQALVALANTTQTLTIVALADLSAQLVAVKYEVVQIILALRAKLTSAGTNIAAQIIATINAVVFGLSEFERLVVRVEQKKIAIFIDVLAIVFDATPVLIANLTDTLNVAVSSALSVIRETVDTLANTTYDIRIAVSDKASSDLEAVKSLVETVIAALKAKLLNATVDTTAQISAALAAAKQLLGEVVSAVAYVERRKLEILLYVLSNGVELTADLIASITAALKDVSVSSAVSAIGQALDELKNASLDVKIALIAKLTAEFAELQSVVLLLIDALNAKLASAELSALLGTAIEYGLQVLASIVITLARLERAKLEFLVYGLLTGAELTTELLSSTSAAVNAAISSVLSVAVQAFGRIANVSKEVRMALLAKLSEAVAQLNSVLLSVFYVLQAKLANVADSIAVLLDATIDSVVQGLVIVVNTFIQIERIKLEIVENALALGADLSAGLFVEISGALNAFITFIQPFVEQVLAALQSASQDVVNALVDKLTVEFGALKTVAAALITRLKVYAGTATGDLPVFIENVVQVLAFVVSVVVRVERIKIAIVVNTVTGLVVVTVDLLSPIVSTLNASVSSVALLLGEVVAVLASVSNAVQVAIVAKLSADLSVFIAVVQPLIVVIQANLVNATGDVAVQLGALLDTVVQVLGTLVGALGNIERIKLAILSYVLQNDANLTAEQFANIAAALNATLSAVLNAVGQVKAVIANASQAVQSVVAAKLYALLVAINILVDSVSAALGELVANASGDIAVLINSAIDFVGSFSVGFRVQLTFFAAFNATP